MTNSGEKRRAEMRWQSRCPLLLVSCLAGAVAMQFSGCSSASQYGDVNRMFMSEEDKTLSLNAEGVSLLDAGKLNKAELRFLRALELNPNDGAVRNNLGILHYERRQYSQAIEFFSKAAELRPDDPRPRNNLGQCCEAMGDLPRSEAFYTQAQELAPSEAEYMGNLVRSRMRAGKTDDVTAYMLNYLLTIESRAQWRVWAQRQLTLVMGFDSRTPPIDLATDPALSPIESPNANYPAANNPTATPPVEPTYEFVPAEDAQRLFGQ